MLRWGISCPALFGAISAMEVARVNLPVALLIWLMIIPMLVKIDFAALGQVTQHWRGIGVTLFINWAVKPFSMALLGWFFIGYLFRPWLPADQIDSYIAGLILLAAAPCTAMVFVWSNLTRGEPHFTLSQVALNDVIMIVAFAPIVALLLGPVGHHGAVADAASVGRALHHCARHCRTGDPPGGARSGGEAALQRLLKTLQPFRCWRCLPHSSCSSPFRGSRSWHSLRSSRSSLSRSSSRSISIRALPIC